MIYALTITPKGKKTISKRAYNMALDRYQVKYGYEIYHRYFEVGPKYKKLHVHCLLDSDTSIYHNSWQKNHHVVCEPCHDKQGWLEYIRKDTLKQKRLV